MARFSFHIPNILFFVLILSKNIIKREIYNKINIKELTFLNALIKIILVTNMTMPAENENKAININIFRTNKIGKNIINVRHTMWFRDIINQYITPCAANIYKLIANNIISIVSRTRCSH